MCLFASSGNSEACLGLDKAGAPRGLSSQACPQEVPSLGETEQGPDTPICKIRPGARGEVKYLPKGLRRRGLLKLGF